MDKHHTDWTVDEFARHYVETLNAQSNGWGQHVSKRLGWSSTRIMMEMYTRFGKDAANAAIDAALKEEPNHGREGPGNVRPHVDTPEQTL